MVKFSINIAKKSNKEEDNSYLLSIDEIFEPIISGEMVEI